MSKKKIMWQIKRAKKKEEEEENKGDGPQTQVHQAKWGG